MNDKKAIEIEKKVQLEQHHIEEIQSKGTFIEETHFIDTYFDTPDFAFTIQNIWLRKRQDQFELKVGINKEGGVIDRYEEITEKERILTHLGLFKRIPTICWRSFRGKISNLSASCLGGCPAEEIVMESASCEFDKDIIPVCRLWKSDF